MKTNNSFAEISQALKSASKIVVLSHYNPDADAYGSSCGLGLALREMGKQVQLVNSNGSIERYRFIPGAAEVLAELPTDSWDVLVACDCGDRKRVGDLLLPRLAEFPLVINIDHHVSNDFFGNLNIVSPESCSTSQIIADLLRSMAHAYSADVATALFAGLSGDTGSFRYSNTTNKVFELAAELVAAGAKPYLVSQALYATNSRQAVMLQAEALTNLRTLLDGKIALVTVREALMKKYSASADDTESLVEQARDIDGVQVAVFIREEDGVFKASLRSRQPEFNVSAIASKFGGGGHVQAAGFRWKSSYEELEARLLDAVTQLFKK